MTEQDLGAIELPRAGPRRSSAIDARNEQWRATEPGRLVNFCCAVGVCSERPGDLAIDLWRPPGELLLCCGRMQRATGGPGNRSVASNRTSNLAEVDAACRAVRS